MPFVEIQEHEKKCGSQTEKCAKCNRYIQRKGEFFHMLEIDNK